MDIQSTNQIPQFVQPFSLTQSYLNIAFTNLEKKTWTEFAYNTNLRPPSDKYK